MLGGFMPNSRMSNTSSPVSAMPVVERLDLHAVRERPGLAVKGDLAGDHVVGVRALQGDVGEPPGNGGVPPASMRRRSSRS